jgi:hypothetical protein
VTATAAQRVGLVGGDLECHRRDEIEVGQRAAHQSCPVRDRIEEQRRLLGNERVAQPAVGELAGQSEIARAHRGDVDRDVRAPAAARQRQGIDLARMLQPFTARHDADDLDRLARRLHRPREPDAVPALHDPGAGHPDPQAEAATGERLQRQRGRGEQRRRP